MKSTFNFPKTTHIFAIFLVSSWIPCSLSEPTTARYTYNSSDLSYLSNGIQIPAPSAPGEQQAYVAEGVENSGVEKTSDMQWFIELYNQHKWLERIQNVENKKCQREMEDYLRNLLNGTVWAAKMFDASGHYNAPFFFGNDYWLGSKTLCEDIQHINSNTEIPPFPLRFYVAKIRININTNLTPVTRQINLGECIPKSCAAQDLKSILTQKKSHGRSVTVIDVRPVPGSYSLLDDIKVRIVGGCGLFTALIMLIASLVEVTLKKRKHKETNNKDIESEKPENYYGNHNNNVANNNSSNKYNDVKTKEMGNKEIANKQEENSEKNDNTLLRLLLSFSAYKNGKRILSVESNYGAITCIHGLRFFSIAWIILVHTYLELFGVGKNKNYRVMSERTFMYQLISNATFSVDTFFFISGLLVTLLGFRTDKKKIKSPKKQANIEVFLSESVKLGIMLVYRFFRLTPAYLFVLGTNEIVMRYIHNQSVLTPAIIDHLTCDKYWWRNALYINNFFPQHEFCMLWSWYIANDTQFFVIASVLMIIAVRGSKQLKFAFACMAVLLLSSWVTTFWIAMQNDYIARVEEPFALFDQLYDKPWMRIGPYLVGMAIGYYLFKVNCEVVLHPLVVSLGWILSITCLGSLVYGLGNGGLVVPASAFYASFGHTAWCLSLAWITVACASGYGGPFNCLLSCKLFLPLSRLTYCAYLVHPVLMCLTSFALEGPIQLHDFMAVVVFFGNVVVSFIVSFFISVMFEAPAINLLKIIFRS